MSEHTKETAGQKMSEFITKQKKVLVSILIIAVAVIVVVSLLSFNANKKSYDVANSTTELMELFEKVSISDDENSEDFIAYANKLIAEKSGTKAELLAYSRLASYYFDKGEFQKAVDNYTLAYTKFPEDLASSVNMFNAAMSYEELGNVDEAIKVLEELVEVYKSSIAEGNDLSSDVPEALFNLGRLYEAKDDVENAVAKYEILVSEYNSYNLAGLAKSRLIVIK